MLETTNFDLQKPEPMTDNVNIEVLNGNMDVIDTALGNTAVYETAGGTATAITLTGITLLGGHSKTFVVSANNNGAATTINGKPLYKPGGTSAPKLIAGKAVSVWYDTGSGGRFFIKASAEGDAVAANVLAGKTFSNDDDTGLAGAMPDRGAVTITPGTADQVIPGGFHSGSGKVVGDQDLISANIRAGANIFGVAGNSNVVDTSAGDATAAQILSGKKAYVDGTMLTGTMTDRGAVTVTPSGADQVIPAGYHNGSGKVSAVPIISDGVYNFPLSIQDAQPTAIRSGHIWIKSSTLASQITAVKILEAVNAGEANGTLMLVVGDLSYRQMSFSHNKLLTSGGTTKTFSIADNSDGSADWLVSSLTGGVAIAIKLKRPFVYSKIGGVLDIETAYMWNGSSWVLVSQKGNYMLLANEQNIAYYNKINDAFNLGGTIGTGVSLPISASKDGTYILTPNNVVYKRTGDVYALYSTIPGTHLYVSSTGVMRKTIISGNGTVASLYTYNYNNSYYYFIVTYKDNGSAFVMEYVTSLYNAGTNSFSEEFITCSDDASIVIGGFYTSVGHRAVSWFRGVSGFTAGSDIASSITSMMVSYDNAYLIITHGLLVSKYTINYANRTLTFSGSSPSITNGFLIRAMHPSGYVFGLSSSPFLKAVKLSDMSVLNNSGSTPNITQIAFNLSGDRLIAAHMNYYYYYSLSFVNSTTFNVTNISFTSTYHTINGVCIIPY